MLINFPDLDQKFERNTLSEYDLFYPKSKGCFIILWMYTIEPPLYFFLNQACRLRDYKVVRLLGPFAAAIGAILGGISEDKRPDTIKCGLK